MKSYLVQCQSGVGATTKHKMCVCVVFFFQVKSDRLTTCITLIVLIVVNGQCAYALHCTHSLAQAQVEVEMITILMLQQLTTMMMKCGYNFVIVAVPLFRFVSFRLVRLLWHLALILYLLLWCCRFFFCCFWCCLVFTNRLLLSEFPFANSFYFGFASNVKIFCAFPPSIHFSPRNGFLCDCYYYLFHSGRSA